MCQIIYPVVLPSSHVLRETAFIVKKGIAFRHSAGFGRLCPSQMILPTGVCALQARQPLLTSNTEAIQAQRLAVVQDIRVFAVFKMCSSVRRPRRWRNNEIGVDSVELETPARPCRRTSTPIFCRYAATASASCERAVGGFLAVNTAVPLPFCGRRRRAFS